MRHHASGSLAAACIATFAASACDQIEYIPEARAVVLAREVLAERGVAASDETYTLTGISACDGRTPETCEVVAFTLDGWDPARRVGFEYVATNDADFGKNTRWSDIGPDERLQAAVDAALSGTGDIVFVIRQWAHETETLAEEQFVSRLEQRLDERGL